MSKLEELLSSAADPPPTDRSRRRFLSSMVGAASLSLYGCSRSGHEGETGEGAPEPEPEPPSIVASYQPRFDRVHSQSSYRAIASKSAAIALVERSSRDAIVDATLIAIERDLIFDDRVSRKSQLVLMGEYGEWFIGFTYRYLVDMTYPSNAVESDGVGTPEWGRHQLQLLGSTFTLRQLRSNQEPSHVSSTTAWYEPIGDHDAAIVYFPKSPIFARASLGITSAPAVIREALSASSSLFGLDYILISPQSLERMRSRLEQRTLELQLFVTGLAVAALVFVPLFGSIGGAGLLSKAMLSPTNRALLAKSLPMAIDLGRELSVGEGGFSGPGSGEIASLSLLGVELPRDDADAVAMVGKFLAALVEHDGAAQLVDFRPRGSLRAAQVFVPGMQLNLSAELLSRGLARLDTNDMDVIREFPEFVDLALGAVEARQNLAAGWAEDGDYVATLRALNRVVSG